MEGAACLPVRVSYHRISQADEGRPRAHRRRVLLIGGIFAAVGALSCTAAVLLGRQRVARAHGQDDSRGGDAYTVLFQELRQPEIRRSVDGVLNTTFHITPAHITDGPISYMSRTYEGTVPGPTLMLKPGDVLHIKQVNRLRPDLSNFTFAEHSMRLPNTTTIHTHGLHVSPAGIADNMFRMLGSGEEADSVYHIRPDHQPGLFFYHPHFHGSTTIQMAGGMAGAIVIEDEPDSLPPELASARELLVFLQHVNVESGTFRNYVFASTVSHSLLNPLVHYSYRGAPGNYFIVNGQYQPMISVQPGELVRLRMVNSGINDYLVMELPGCQLHEIAADGVYYSVPRPRRTVVMVVGSRKDVLVQCPIPGLYTASSTKPDLLVKSYFGPGTDIFQGSLFHMRVSGQSVDMALPTWLPAPAPPSQPQFKPLVQLPPQAVHHFDFEFFTGSKVPRNGALYNVYGVNKALRPITDIQRRVKLGDVEEWRVTSYREDGRQEFVNHPFHMHTNHFQIVDMSHGEGIDYEVGDWRDSISLPLSRQGGAFVTMRWKANDFTGLPLAHCHIIPHADTGMSMTFEIYDEDSNEN